MTEANLDAGSPPRVRGRGRLCGKCGLVPGITPARAGKRWPRQAHRGRGKDHPRACGEEHPFAVLVHNAIGSPPRVRGRDSRTIENRPSTGITPARAGKSPPGGSCRWAGRDHPRACGEEAPVALTVKGMMGSPPRVRGRVPPGLFQRVLQRITPARAGKSFTQP